MLWGGGDLLGEAEFDDLAAAHDGDAIAEVAHDRHGVRDEEIGKAEVALKFFEQVDDLRANADVKRGDWFVTDDEFGAQDKRAGNADTLALSAREFVRVAAQGGFLEADGADDFGSSVVKFRCGGALAISVDQQRLGDDRFNAHARIERGERVLEDDLHVTAKAAKLCAGCRKDVLAVEGDGAGGGFDEAENHPAQSGLAAAGFADQAKRFAFRNFERDTVYRPDLARGLAEETVIGVVNLDEIANGEQRHNPHLFTAEDAKGAKAS